MRREKCRFSHTVRLYAPILPIGVVTTGDHCTTARDIGSVLVANADIRLQWSPEFGSPPYRVLSLTAGAVMLTFAEAKFAKAMV